MKLTVKEANIIADALASKKHSLEWYCRAYDEEGNVIEGKLNPEAEEYGEYVIVEKLIAKLEGAEV